MPEELAPLRAHLTDVRRVGRGAAEVVTARLGGRAVALMVTGDGERKAREGFAVLMATLSVDRLIAIGVAGGLSPELPRGALVVAERVVGEDGPVLLADAALVDEAVRATGARRAVVLSAHRIADSAPEKQRLLRAAAGTPTTPAVVDLESAAYASAAARMEIPWLVLRAVTDTADEELPPLLNRCRDAGGAVRRGSVVRELFGDPGALPLLLALRRNVRQGAEVLTGALLALFQVSPAPAFTASSGMPIHSPHHHADPPGGI